MASTLPPVRSPKRRGKPPEKPQSGGGSSRLGTLWAKAFPQNLFTPEWWAMWRERSETRSFRLVLAWLLLLGALSGMGLKLLHLQVIEGKSLTKKAQAQQLDSLRPYVPRRPIIDRLNNVLASDQRIYTLYAHPKLFKIGREEMAKELSQIINLPKEKLTKRFKDQESGIEVAVEVPENTARRIRRLGFDGLELIEQQQRFYPQGELFGSIVGYVNSDRNGQAGLEQSQQTQLERPSKPMRIRRLGDGSVVPENLPEGFLHQDELRLQLTLDSRLQRAAKNALVRQLDAYGAKRGTAIVMDAKDGGLLALVSSPSFDPNRFWEFDVSLFQNWAITDLYEPGSTFKPVVLAMALESGALKANDYLYDYGQVEISGHIVQNSDFTSAGGRGPLSINEAMKYSSNIAMVEMARKMGPAVFYEWLEKVGLGKTLLTDLPGAPASQLKTRQEFIDSAIEPATAAFGQGLSLTPLQLMQLHGALANGGKLMTPHVVSGLVDSKGQTQWRPDIPTARPIFSPQTTKTVLEAMESAIATGTGKAAAIPGYRIGGKTGTAQKAENGVYVAGARITSFVSILPIENPRYVVMVVVDEPIGENAYGGTVAAPVVKEIMEAVISTYGLPAASAPVPLEEAASATPGAATPAKPLSTVDDPDP